MYDISRFACIFRISVKLIRCNCFRQCLVVDWTCRHGPVWFTRQRILTDVLNAPSKPNARVLHPDSDVNVTAHWFWKMTIRILQAWSLSMLSVQLTGFLIQSFRWTISRAMEKCSASRRFDQGPCFCHGAHRHPISQYTEQSMQVISILIASASNKSSGESGYMRRLTRAIAVRMHKVWM